MSVHGAYTGKEDCPKCGKDNLQRQEDGYAKCYTQGCGHWEGVKGDREAEGSTGAGHRDSDSGSESSGDGVVRAAALLVVEYDALPARAISEETCRKFHYGIGTYKGKPVQVARYGDAQKTRDGDKKFRWIGKHDGKLFGQSLWRPQKRLVITEGELDCLSYAEATKCAWPVVSVPHGAQGAKKAIAENIEWLEAFEEVIFMFDMDEPGQSAAKECALLLTPGKARIASLARKDASEVLVELGSAELYKAPFSAAVFRPDGIVQGVELIDQILQRPARGISYPWPCLDAFLHGQRPGEMVTWVAGTGVGKSQVMREIARGLAVTHDQRVGIIALEESNKESGLGQISLELDCPLHIPERRDERSETDIAQAGQRVLKNFVFYDHWGSVEADTLLPKIRYMAHAMKVRWVVLDHLSIMVSGMAVEGDERKRIDQITTQLRSLCSELNIGLHIVSHLRKASGTPHEEGGRVSLQEIRGSGAPAQLSNLVVALERNQQAEGEDKNKTVLRVLKNRLTGETGVAGALHYDRKTGRLTESSMPQGDFPDGDF